MSGRYDQGGSQMTDLTVYKSNSLIQAAYRLSVNEQRIVLNCIAQINAAEDVTDDVMYKVSLHDISQQTGIEINNLYKDFKAAALRLQDRKVRIPAPTTTTKDRVLITYWVQTIAYSDSEATIELRFSKDILPYLTQLKEQFTKYKLKHVAKMKSTYGVRLYELLIQHKQFGSREIEIEWLREIFQLKNNYPAIKDFKKRVIEPALKDINETSNLWVTYTQKKSGRRVTHFTFVFGDKSGAQKGSGFIANSFIERNALPGETWDEAKDRLIQEGDTHLQEDIF
jgi:plasmid replication initiation protein